ncbi:MAG: prephenate dehydrogenase/arogenate dehydrogenase family protein [Burkholderiaceae bacterium]
MFDRLALIGCGLIGGSFALALRAAGQVREVVGYDRDAAAAQRAVELGIVDRREARLADAVTGADLVVVAAPVAQAEALFVAIAASLAPHALVTDVGSTKRDVIAAARRGLGDAAARFVPGHPIAGREVHGPDAADADLFRNRRVLLTPLADNAAADVARIAAAWTACGARVDCLDPAVHDAVLSSVSHLPHLLAYALVAQIADADDAALKFSLAGGGFRDFTRIAASSPEMWRDIAMANRDALLRDLDAYRSQLDALRGWIAGGDADSVEALFVKASAARGAWRPG